jgi:hypothetical protein
MSINHHLLGYLGTVAALHGVDVFFVSGLPRKKSTSDLDEELRAAFEAWARSGSEIEFSTLRSAELG